MAKAKAAMGTAALLLIGAGPPAPGERVVTGDGVVAVTINGVPGELRVDPAAPGVPLLLRSFADRVGLKTPGKIGIEFIFSVGPARVFAPTKVARVSFGDKPDKQRVAWTGRRFGPLAEGSVGPAGLPEPVVRFVLREPRPGERSFSLPMEVPGFGGSLFGGGWAPTYARIDIGGAAMRIRFDPHHSRSLATAGAAVRLAQAYGGTLSGEATPTEINFGIERPVRSMRLARPLAIGPLSLSALGVRVADDGSARAIPEASAAAPTADPDEVVVTARGKKHDPKRDTLSLGADALSRCSSIVFDKPAHQIRLTCA